MKTSRITCIVLCFIMLIVLLPTAALANEPIVQPAVEFENEPAVQRAAGSGNEPAAGITAKAQREPGVWVGNTDVSGGGYWLNDGQGGITSVGASENNYNVHYATDTNASTLTLNGASITENFNNGSGLTAAIYAELAVTINLEGDSNVIGASGVQSVGIFSMYDLTIKGSGSLTATGGTASSLSCGVICLTNFTISGGVVKATGSDASFLSSGVYCINNATISGGIVEAIGGDVTSGRSCGISSVGVTISGGTTKAAGGNVTIGRSYGMLGYNAVNMSGGAIEAIGGNVTSGYSYGISSSNVTISGGTVKATGGDVTEGMVVEGKVTAGFSNGVFTENNIFISGGTVECNGGEVTSGSSYGMFGNNNYEADNIVNITGGTVTASGGRAGSSSCGLYGVRIGIENSTVTATGSEAENGPSYGIMGGNSVKITSGAVKATGLSNGLFGYNSVTISGGTTLCTGNVAAVQTQSLDLTAYPVSRTFTVSTDISGWPAEEYAADNLLTYKYFYIGPPPEPSHDYTVTVYNDTSKPNATIRLSGIGLAPDDLLITERNPQGAAYSLLRTVAGENEVIATYNISLKSGKKSTGSDMSLTFSLDAKYAGQEFTLVHQKADGTYEYFYATVNANGKLVFNSIYSLSPFMLVRGRLAQTAYINLADAPKTGDSAQTALLAGAASLMAAALLLGQTSRKRRN